MSGRSLTVAVRNALGDVNLPLALFVEMAFTGGTVRTTSLPYHRDWNGFTWLGLGRLGSIDAVEEGEAIEGREVAFVLSGVADEDIAIALAEKVQGRPIKAWFAPLDADHNVIVSPVLFYRGKMDCIDLVEGDSSSLRLNTRGRLADFERARELRWNNETWQSLYPGDKYCEFVPQMVEHELRINQPNA